MENNNTKQKWKVGGGMKKKKRYNITAYSGRREITNEWIRRRK
jgi:hypothetical protein